MRERRQAMATPRKPTPPTTTAIDAFCARFDDLFCRRAERLALRPYRIGLLLPREHNMTLSALAALVPGTTGQRLHHFGHDAPWDLDALNRRRLALWQAHPTLGPHAAGVLIVDETGDRKRGHRIPFAAQQYTGKLGHTANGVVSVTSQWADGTRHVPLGVCPTSPPRACRARRPTPPSAPSRRWPGNSSRKPGPPISPSAWWPIASTASIRSWRRTSGRPRSPTCWRCSRTTGPGRSSRMRPIRRPSPRRSRRGASRPKVGSVACAPIATARSWCAMWPRWTWARLRPGPTGAPDRRDRRSGRAQGRRDVVHDHRPAAERRLGRRGV